MSTRLSVFISAAGRLHRDARGVYADLDAAPYKPFFFKIAGARGLPPNTRIQREISGCDVLILLLGPYYGTHQERLGCSTVQHEFNLATERSDVEIMGFVKLRQQENDEQQEEDDERQAIFIADVQDYWSGISCQVYSTDDDLQAVIKQSLVEWLVDYFCVVKQQRMAIQRNALTVALCLMIAMIVWFLFLTFSPVQPQVAAHIAIGICATASVGGHVLFINLLRRL